jgi:Mg2+ and Co2+ transporter CorA
MENLNNVQNAENYEIREGAYANDLTVLATEIKTLVNVAKSATQEIAGRLYHAKANIFKDNYKEFIQWAMAISSLKETTINKYVLTYEKFFTNGPSVTFSRATELLSFPAELIETELYTSKKQLLPLKDMPDRDIRLIARQYRQAEEEGRPLEEVNYEASHADEILKEREREIQRLKEQLENVKQAAPAPAPIIQAEPEKIIEFQENPETLQQLQNLKRDLQKVTVQKAAADKKLLDYAEKENYLEHTLQLQKQEALKYKQIQDEIQALRNNKKELVNQVNDLVELAKFNSNVRDLLRTIAPLKYSEVVRRNLQNDVVQMNVKETIALVKEWVYEMEQVLNYRFEVIEGNFMEGE